MENQKIRQAEKVPGSINRINCWKIVSLPFYNAQFVQPKQ
jgi:hypothetical protein